ncbi:hypothetical protein C6500_15640 [Candidatus Poribacteria bacterium]|nr:MAG: hypothetical protein C6500_15640 [Candidatus Poribacteria bacterium]
MKVELDFWVVRVFVLVFFVVYYSGNISAETETESAHRVATAVRIKDAPPQLDGILDDDIWKIAPLHEGFRQRDPDEGEPASQHTTFQVAYDDEAVYFAVMCYDSEPNKIVSRLVRRDDYVESDKVQILLDPHYNRQRAFSFTIYPSGSVIDGITEGGGWRGWNNAWDGVWDAKTRIHKNGWAVECKIPFYMFRFSPKDKYTWGLQVEREISRRKERAHWRLIKKGEAGWLSHFGDLIGIENIQPSRHLELIPYAMGRTTLNRATDLWGNVGGDVQYGITTGTTLNATVNPDFGQVEADPATLNLSAYEEFFEERRPFFVKGSSIFNFGEGENQFFYSRRIGRQPRHVEIPEGATELSRPEATTILGAAKIVGRTNSNTSFGIMEAVTAPEYVQIKEKGKDRDHLSEPLTNYFVGRVTQDILEGNSRIGLITTSVNRQASNAAYVGGLDWDLRFAKERYKISGMLAASQAGKLESRKSGYLAHIEFDKQGGWWRLDTDFNVRSPGLDINDIGYTQRGDMMRWFYDLMFKKEQPFSIFREVTLGLYGWREWNYNGVSIGRYSEIWTDGKLKNYWEYDLWVGRNLESFRDEDVRRGGTLIKNPAGWWIFTQLRTDSRKMVQLELNPIFAWDDDTKSSEKEVNLRLNIRPVSNIELSIGPMYRYRIYDAQWVELVEENVGGHIKKHYVYGELTAQTLDFTTRANISFTPTLSLQFYIQPFITIGDYTNFKELIEPKSYQFKPYPLKRNPDFHMRSLRGNTVLRWEFRPGSTLFLVWSQSREIALEDIGEADLEFRPIHRLRDSFTDPGKNIFLVKCRYWFGI